MTFLKAYLIITWPLWLALACVIASYLVIEAVLSDDETGGQS